MQVAPPEKQAAPAEARPTVADEPAAPTCTKQHTLQPYETPGGYCDLCLRVCLPPTIVYDCRECDWFMCSACAASGLFSARVDAQRGYGRVVVSEVQLEPDSLVLREAPCLVWDTPDGSNQAEIKLLEAFARASESVKAVVLDFYFPALDGQSELILRRKQQSIELAAGVGLDAETCQAVILIVDCNAHAYTGCVNDADQSWSANAAAALFPLGARVSHSCRPNVNYSSKNARGMMELLSIRTINPADQIAISYLTGLWTSPCWQRQTQLKAKKDFICLCERCTGADDTRGARCRSCSCVVFPQCAVNSSELDRRSWQWSCAECGKFETDPSEFEEDIEGQLANCKQEWHNRKPKDCERIATKAAKLLSPVHHLVATAHELNITICASHVAAMRKVGGPVATKIPMFLAEAVDAATKAVQVVECMAAGCPVGLGCGKKHKPVFENGPIVFMAAQDCFQLEPASQPRHVVECVERYLPMLLLLYGKRDPDVAAIQRLVQEFWNHQIQQAAAGVII